MKKRLLSILLAAIMLLPLMPATTVADEGDTFPTTGLDLTYVATPTTYSAGGGTVEWNPSVTPATLTFNSAVINVENDGWGATAVKLPDREVRVIFNDTNSITAANMTSACAFACYEDTTFELTTGSVTTLTAASNVAASENAKDAYGIYASLCDITITGGGALNMVIKGGTISSPIKCGKAILNDVTIPESGKLDLSVADSLSFEGNNFINGELVLRSGTDVTAEWEKFDGDGRITVNNDSYYKDGTRFGGEVKTTGLDLKKNTPKVKTTYTTGGERTIVWEPTLGDGGAITSGKLTFTNAKMEIAAHDTTVCIVKLPEFPVEVFFYGTNNLELGSDSTPIATTEPNREENYDENQYSGFLCGSNTIFHVDGETNLTVMNNQGRNVYALNNKTHDTTVLGSGKLNISTSADASKDKAEIRIGNDDSDRVTLYGGFAMSGVVKPSVSAGSNGGCVLLGSITIPEGKTLDLSAVLNVKKYDGTAGAVNDGLLMLRSDTDVAVLQLTGTGIVKVGDSYYDNNKEGIPTKNYIDFTDEHVTWKEEATFLDDGYTYSHDAATDVYTITFGNLVVDADSTAPAVKMPNGNVNVVLNGITYIMNKGGGVCVSAANPITIHEGGKLYMGASGTSACALSAPSLALIKTAIKTPAGAAFSEANGKIMLDGSPVKIVTIGSSTPTATIGDVSVSGVKDVAIADTDLSVTLASEQFTGVSAGQDVKAWFANIPEGLAAKVKSVTGITAVITISGTPSVTKAEAMSITIPADCLVCNEALAVTANESARWAISIDPAAGNKADINAAKTAIENGAWALAQSAANTEDAVKKWVADKLAEMNLNGVSCTVSISGFTAAVAGTQSSKDGTNGAYSFTVALAKGDGEAKAVGTATLSDCVITATKYVPAPPAPSASPAPVHEHSPEPEVTQTPAQSGAIYNDNHTTWLTSDGLLGDDMLIMSKKSGTAEYDALLKLANGAEVMGVYDISLRSGRKSIGSAMYLHFDLAAKYAGKTFTLVHQKADKTYEYFTATADANGDVKFGALFELSPFMLVRGEIIRTAVQSADIPQTGEAPQTAFFVGIALIALLGAAVTVRIAGRKRA